MDERDDVLVLRTFEALQEAVKAHAMAAVAKICAESLHGDGDAVRP
eukprot:CAMPEP_0170600308 /NCGR_PEP_ID=MMETSP0224-20130122/17264_1 /TAXON_ID=285029 /ORGANISM="Togula jolla, Strain CCCM 725" /LENGTH=45 /DNA_ID= /DNA_START= /DNA_END= /DNA_ORIENTATION=